MIIKTREFSSKRFVCVVALAVLSALLATPGDSLAKKDKQKKEGITAKKGAGIGALLGLALGGGVSDIVGGAALGAASGAIAREASSASKKKREREEDSAMAQAEREQIQSEVDRLESEREALLMQREQELGEREQEVARLQREIGEAIEARADAEAAIIASIGEDNWEAYKALRGCQHDRASALAQAGGTSSDPEHQVAALWIQAMAAVDRQATPDAEPFWQALIEKDSDIDSAQQASLATDQAILGMRGERRDLGIAPCF